MRAGPLASFVLACALLLPALGAPSPAYAQRSRAMGVECRGVGADTPASRLAAEQWVQARLQAFVPRGDPSLRMRTLQLQAEQVKLAFGSIRSTCAQYLAGAIERETADLSLHGYEQTIANFLRDLGNDAVVRASRGYVADMEGVRSTLTEIGTTGRQAALLGDETIAEAARQKMVDALVAFSRAFAEACFDQTFDPRIAMALDRQNQILGTGIDVTPCARRQFSAEGKGADILWRFSHCGTGVGEWKIVAEGPLQGEGTGTVDRDLSGTWSLAKASTEHGVQITYSGDLSVTLKPAAGEDDLPVADRLHVRATHSTVTADGETFSSSLDISGLSFVVKTSDRPCRPGDESS